MAEQSHAAIHAMAELHHQYLLGLELMVATREGPDVIGDWMFRLFRRQHEEKFLSSFEKLGLADLPHAVACAKYHVLSNSMGGVAVEYAEESDTKAWVRFRYPRWMYDGAVICGVPVEASRGFLKGWYGQNGVSLKNPRLGFVCVSEDMTGQFGLCGYFKEFDHDLSEDERLSFAPDERPPAFDPSIQPAPPAAEWSEERLAKASRNYAAEYIRNGLTELARVLGRQRTEELAKHAARLTGLQYGASLRSQLGTDDGGVEQAASLMARALSGMGDEIVQVECTATGAELAQQGTRLVRGLPHNEADLILSCWEEIWRGVLNSHRAFMSLACERLDDGLKWTITAD